VWVRISSLQWSLPMVSERSTSLEGVEIAFAVGVKRRLVVLDRQEVVSLVVDRAVPDLRILPMSLDNCGYASPALERSGYQPLLLRRAPAKQPKFLKAQ
jgi:hypothetical protein